MQFQAYDNPVNISRELVRNALASIVLGGICLLGWPPTSTLAAAILVLWLPGASVVRAIARLDDIPGRRTVIVAASMSLVVFPLSWFWRFSNTTLHVTLFVCGLNVLLALVAHGVRVGRTESTGNAPSHPSEPRGVAPWLLGAICGWMAICVLGSFWIPTAFHRVAANGAHDYVKHHAIVFSLNEYPLPLHNVFNAVERDGPYFYYEYHYLLAASIRSMAGLQISIAFALGLVSAVLAVVVIRLTFWMSLSFTKTTTGALLSAACVSVLGGWDIVPVMINLIGGQSMPVILDSWCPVAWRIHNLATQYYWCPQHVGAVCTLLLTAYWLTHAPKGRWWLILGPCLGASVFGASVYVAIPVFLATAIFCLHALWHHREGRGRFAAAVLLIAVIGAALMVVQALGYREMASRFDGGLTLTWERFPLALLGRVLSPGPLANYLDAWWLAIIDFGIPALALILINRNAWERAWSLPGLRLLIISGVVGVVAMFTMRSSVNPIDYGFRVAIMPTMIVAAILAGGLMRKDWVRPSLVKARMPLLILGAFLSLPVGFYESPLSAARSLVRTPVDHEDAGAYRYLREEAPRDAVVQAAPTDDRVTLPQIISRQIGASDTDNWHVRVFWPPNTDRLREAVALAESAFKSADAQFAYDALSQLNVTHVLAGTVERATYGPLPQFEAEVFFEQVYSDQHARVYRLKAQDAVD
ncbi:MAG: hypothetical protein DHS20C16_04470 [Phycisphaerae bacterium]|nr:MAG: hypothetical protein DHS20C16_04470 [Phycisphaerae bacterium]